MADMVRQNEQRIIAYIGGCLLFLEVFVENNKKTAPLGATKFEKVNDQLNKLSD